MEFLLNLVWLLLALPASWLWLRSARARESFSSSQCLLALSCALVILFPVISATDDLRAMRAVMEESPASKRNLRHVSTEKSSGNGRLHPPPAILHAEIFFSLRTGFAMPQPLPKFSFSSTRLLHTGRSPPASRFA